MKNTLSFFFSHRWKALNVSGLCGKWKMGRLTLKWEHWFNSNQPCSLCKMTVMNTCINWIYWVVVGVVWRFHWLILTAGLQIRSNLLSPPLCWDLSFIRLFVHRVYSLAFFVVTPTRGVCMCMCVCVPAIAGASPRDFSQNLGLALWFKAGQLIQGRTESEKECDEEEWATDGEKVGRMPDSIESLCTAFEVRGWGFRGKQDYSESIPLNNPGVWAAAKKQRSLTNHGCSSLCLPNPVTRAAQLIEY